MPSGNRPKNFDYSKKKDDEILKIFNANSTSDNEKIKTLHEKAKFLLNEVKSVFDYFNSIDGKIEKNNSLIKKEKEGTGIFSKLPTAKKKKIGQLSDNKKCLENIKNVLKKFMYGENHKKVADFEKCYLYVKILEWDKEVYSKNEKTGAIVFNKPFEGSHQKLFKLKLTENSNESLKNFVDELGNVYSIIDQKESSNNDFRKIAAEKFGNLFNIVNEVYNDPEGKCGAFDDWVKNGVGDEAYDKIINDSVSDIKDKKDSVVTYIKTALIGEELLKFFQTKQCEIQDKMSLQSIVLCLQCIAFIVSKLKLGKNKDYDWVEKIFGVPNNCQYYQNIKKYFKSLDPNTRWNRFKNMLTNTFAGRTDDEKQMKAEMSKICMDADKFIKPLEEMDLGKIVQAEDAELFGSCGKENERIGKEIIELDEKFSKYCQNQKSVPEGWKIRMESRLVTVKLLIVEVYREFQRKIKEAQDNFLNNFALAGNVEGFNPLDCVFYQELTNNPIFGQIGLCICINNKSDFVLKVLNGVLGKLSDINIGARIPSVKLGSLNPKELTIRRVQPLTISLKNKLFALRNDLNVGIYVIVAGASKLLSLVFPKNIAAIAKGTTDLVGLNVDLGTNVDVLKHKDKK